MAYRFAHPLAVLLTRGAVLLARGLAGFDRAALAALLTASLAACSDTERTRDIELQFDARIGSQRVACGAPLAGVGENGRTTSLKDLRFFVHDVQLIDGKGKHVALEMPNDEWQFKNVALLDFEDKTGDCKNGSPQTNALIRGKAPAGDYKSISFRVGVPSDLNHEDPGKLRAPLGDNSLYWGWKLGFIFLRLDLAMADTSSDQAAAFEVHLGADQCSSTKGTYACGRPNVPEVTLSGFDWERDKVVFDLAALLEQVTVASRPLQPPNMMSTPPEGVAGCASGDSDPDCEPVFSAFGLDLAKGSVTGSAQTAFSVQERESGDPDRSYGPDAGQVVEADAGPSTYRIKLPEGAGFSDPVIPADNPLTAEKIELGRHLFYDKRMSGNQTQSCASCHKQELAFTDGRATGLGSTGQSHIRGAMSLANVVYATSLTWANPEMKELERQARVPMFGADIVELGLEDNGAVLLGRLRTVDKYQTLFKAAYPGDGDAFTLDNVLKAVASFERTLISGNSPYDQYVRTRDESLISESAKRGADLFFDPDPGGHAFECFHCHGVPTFSDQLTHANQPSGAEPFHNTGLYNLDIFGSYPAGNEGVFEDTGQNNDKGRFKAPTLRNIAVTAPYMHDGSITTLEDVVAHYARGGRLVESGPNMGDGKLNRNKSEFIHGFSGASAQDRADLIEFLKTLTDDEFLTNPAYSDPWQ
jgi:cytochrome c peroxidase